ncbi:MAG TPA: hypothetical protein VK130_02545 [Steroidobacteraceae bacterium]|nr:hypothetical protein [Steroidobacteraceae bacterium]
MGRLVLVACSVAGLALPPLHAQAPAARPEQRVARENPAQRLSRDLGLDEAQRTEVSRILQHRQQQIRNLWSQESVPQAYRVSVMRGINERAEGQIRALLTDEQKEHYIPARSTESTAIHGLDKLDDWLRASQSK